MSARELLIPLDTDIALSTINNEQYLKQEREALKRLVVAGIQRESHAEAEAESNTEADALSRVTSGNRVRVSESKCILTKRAQGGMLKMPRFRRTTRRGSCKVEASQQFVLQK